MSSTQAITPHGERAARARRLVRPQPSVQLICGHQFFYRGVAPAEGAELWCLACDLPSVVADTLNGGRGVDVPRHS